MKCLSAIVLLISLALSVFAQERQGASSKVYRVLRVPQEFVTIQRALDEADAGDTVFVGEGIYKESVTLRDDVALIGVSADLSVIRGNRKKPTVTAAQGALIRNIAVEGGSTGILCANAVMTIESCVIRGNRGTGIHCLISLPVILNNVIYRNTSSGVFCETTRAHKGYISNNVIAENGYSGVMLAGQSEVLVENNVFYFNKQYGVFTAEGARRSRIVYNAFYGNRHPGNAFSVIDASNMHNDPGYIAAGADVRAFREKTPDMLKGRGKDGSDIGTMTAPAAIPSE